MILVEGRKYTHNMTLTYVQERDKNNTEKDQLYMYIDKYLAGIIQSNNQDQREYQKNQVRHVNVEIYVA
jgi:hypothetical protein